MAQSEICKKGETKRQGKTSVGNAINDVPISSKGKGIVHMERLTEKRDGQNVIPLRQNGEVKWALSSAGMGDAPTRFLYGVHADKLAEYEELEERIYKIYGEC